MEAIILGSRSVVQDRFFQKDQDERYRRHQENVRTISKEKNGQLREWGKELQSVTSTLRKSKSAAKLFRDKQEKQYLKGQNMFLLKKIWHLQPSVSTFHPDRYQYVSGSNWNNQKKKLQQIKQENKIIAMKVVHQQVDPTDYKKKLKEEIREYIQLRDGIRKCKLNKAKKAKSQRKQTAGVKLDKIADSKKEEVKTMSKDKEENPEKSV